MSLNETQFSVISGEFPPLATFLTTLIKPYLVSSEILLKNCCNVLLPSCPQPPRSLKLVIALSSVVLAKLDKHIFVSYIVLLSNLKQLF
jgi:hypothetical protein